MTSLSLPPQLPNGDKLSYLPPGGRGSSENGVILSVQVLKVVLGEQSDWNGLFATSLTRHCFIPWEQLPGQWALQSPSKGGSWPDHKFFKSLVYVRTKYQPCTAFKIMSFPFFYSPFSLNAAFSGLFPTEGPVKLSLEGSPLMSLGQRPHLWLFHEQPISRDYHMHGFLTSILLHQRAHQRNIVTQQTLKEYPPWYQLSFFLIGHTCII